MKTKNLLVTLIIVAFVALSCGGKKSYDSSTKEKETSTEKTDELKQDASGSEFEEAGYAETTSAQEPSKKGQQNSDKDDYSRMVSSSAAQISRFDSTHKLIRTAEIKFRTLDVTGTSYSIEDIVKKFGGFTSSTYMSSEVTHTETTRVSPDSLVETTTYHFTNEMIIRVPAENLDTTLKSIVPMIDFLDYRNIKAEDVSLTYLRKQLEKKRLDLYNIQVSGLTTSGNSGDRLAAMESQLEKQIQNDEALIERLELDDQVKYATVTFHIYGRDKTRHVVLADQDKIESYRPGFGRSIAIAVTRGWQVLKLFVLAIITIWPLWLVGGGLTWLGIYLFNRRKKSK